MPAGQAQAKMDPGIPGLQTVFTAFGARRDIMNLVQVRAHGGHMCNSFLSHAEAPSCARFRFRSTLKIDTKQSTILSVVGTAFRSCFQRWYKKTFTVFRILSMDHHV